MFTEIEDKLAILLREKLAEIPKEHVAVDVWPSKPPAIKISNLKFKIQNGDMAENMDMGEVEITERLEGDEVRKSFKLQERPLKDSVRVESPPGTPHAKNDEYTINYDEGSIEFAKPPGKGKDNILVRYCSRKRVMTLKSLIVKGLYSIDVMGADRREADSLAEKVVKALVTMDDKLIEEGIELKPIGGAFQSEGGGKTQIVQLKYSVEKQMRVEQIVGPMERIEISRRNL